MRLLLVSVNWSGGRVCLLFLQEREAQFEEAVAEGGEPVVSELLTEQSDSSYMRAGGTHTHAHTHVRRSPVRATLKLLWLAKRLWRA